MIHDNDTVKEGIKEGVSLKDALQLDCGQWGSNPEPFSPHPNH